MILDYYNENYTSKVDKGELLSVTDGLQLAENR